jgi:hypothetical protein
VTRTELAAAILEAVNELRAAGWGDEGILARAVRDLGVERAAVIARVIAEAKEAA